MARCQCTADCGLPPAALLSLPPPPPFAPCFASCSTYHFTRTHKASAGCAPRMISDAAAGSWLCMKPAGRGRQEQQPMLTCPVLPPHRPACCRAPPAGLLCSLALPKTRRRQLTRRPWQVRQRAWACVVRSRFLSQDWTGWLCTWLPSLAFAPSHGCSSANTA